MRILEGLIRSGSYKALQESYKVVKGFQSSGLWALGYTTVLDGLRFQLFNVEGYKVPTFRVCGF